MSRLVASAVACALAACASSRAERVALRAEATVADDAHRESHVQEERGPTETVIEEFGWRKDESPDGGAEASAPLAPGQVAASPGSSPKLVRRTTIRQLPIGPAGPAVRIAHDDDEWASRLTVAKVSLDATAQSATRPAIGCGVSFGLIAIPLAALGAALLWRFRPWIH